MSREAMDEKTVTYVATVTLSCFDRGSYQYSPIERIQKMSDKYRVACTIEQLRTKYGQGDRYRITFAPVSENAYFIYTMTSLLNSLRGNGYLDHKIFAPLD